MLRRRGGLAERRLRARTERVAALARQEAAPHGSVASRITTDVREGPSGLVGFVISNHPASRYILDGTRPHLIRPRRRKALRFDVGGEIVFAKLVRHPGTRAHNFLGIALRLGR
ncbi:hypothetical protein [Streptomyces sp. NRRL B-1347]|uniref:hypothetical protein n=1 Tax=Streptomyces sp. NRRL B-1347 TaxID=1476877 RepID=UPI001F270B7A|nr:hypothetical protein [Streptomyces sp. NRRL B-1347]